MSITPKLVEGRTAIVFGVANKWSIAWGVARKLAESGARVIMTYQDERFAEKVIAMASEVPNTIPTLCDLTKPEDVRKVFQQVEKEFGGLDILVHSVAFAQKDDLEGNFTKTSAEGFGIAHHVSVYTLIEAVRAAVPYMEKRGGGSVMAMTYYGSEKAMPNYNVMGVAKAALESCVRYLAFELGGQSIRVNALSPGAISTSAARGISNFSSMLQYARDRAPLKRNTEIDEVADAALFLASDLSRGITGEVIHVDCGYHITGM